MKRPGSAAERRRECVKSLLAGELVDHSELEYDLDAHHLGLMAKGEGALEGMRELALRLDRRLLAVRREEEPVWACWLGGRDQLEVEDGAPRGSRDPAGRGPDHCRRARREPLRLATQPPPGQGRAADRRARAGSRGPILGGGPARLDPPRRPRDRVAPPALPRAARGSARRREPPGSPCAPISGPVEMSPPRRRRSASIAAP